MINNTLFSISCLLFVASLSYFFSTKNHRWSLILLVLGAFLLRICMITWDPFLHSWDERYHALVAKNMMQNPFSPMLRMNPILDYKIENWCCNHIWLHKQPLFMWLMSLSMKAFGISEISARIPSLLMGMLSIKLVYDINEIWFKNKDQAFLAAFLVALAYMPLEMTSGRYGVDHNDLSFMFFVTGSIWALTKYLNSRKKSFLLGLSLFISAAILTKWLTALIIFVGWFLYLFLEYGKNIKIKNIIPLLLVIGLTLLFVLPWQIYISTKFPIESAWEYAYNSRHLFEAIEGNAGGLFYHFKKANLIYGSIGQFIVLLGMLLSFQIKDRKICFTFLSMILVYYIFFSIVGTKRSTFCLPMVVIGIGYLVFGFRTVMEKLNSKNLQSILGFFLFGIIAWNIFNPLGIYEYRNSENPARAIKIHNTQTFKKVDQDLPQSYILFNCPALADVEAMFYTNRTCYQWWPRENELDSLLKAGHDIAFFEDFSDQSMPDYVCEYEKVLIINHSLKK